MQPLCVSVGTQSFLGEDQTSERKTKLCRTGVVTCVYNPRTEGDDYEWEPSLGYIQNLILKQNNKMKTL